MTMKTLSMTDNTSQKSALCY